VSSIFCAQVDLSCIAPSVDGTCNNILALSRADGKYMSKCNDVFTDLIALGHKIDIADQVKSKWETGIRQVFIPTLRDNILARFPNHKVLSAIGDIFNPVKLATVKEIDLALPSFRAAELKVLNNHFGQVRDVELESGKKESHNPVVIPSTLDFHYATAKNFLYITSREIRDRIESRRIAAACQKRLDEKEGKKERKIMEMKKYVEKENGSLTSTLVNNYKKVLLRSYLQLMMGRFAVLLLNRDFVDKMECISHDEDEPTMATLLQTYLDDKTQRTVSLELSKIAQIALVIPVSTAPLERAFSKLKLIKSKIRNRLKNPVLDALLRISCHAPLEPSAIEHLITRALAIFDSAKTRNISIKLYPDVYFLKERADDVHVSDHDNDDTDLDC
jgi:hypothetical protein